MTKNKSFKKRRTEKTQRDNQSLNVNLPLASYFKEHRNFIITVPFIVIGVLTFPNIFFVPYSSMECSWVIGLSMAKVAGMQFGKDIIFPFEPLGFMYYPIYCAFNTWLISSLFHFFVHCLVIFTIIIMMKKVSANAIDWTLVVFHLRN